MAEFKFYRYVIKQEKYEVLVSSVARSFKKDLWGAKLPEDFSNSEYELIYLGRHELDVDEEQHVKAIMLEKI